MPTNPFAPPFIPAADLALVTPGDTDTVVGVDQATGNARRFPKSSLGDSTIRPDLASTASGKGAELVGFKQSGAGAVARTMQEKVSEHVSVKDFGAKGDGVTLDHSAILKCFNYCKANGKSPYIPSGTYLADDNFLIDHTYSNMTIYGDGPASCIKLADTLNAANINAGWLFMLSDTVTPIKNFRISGLRLDGSRSTTTWGTTSHGVIVDANTLIESVQVDNCIAHSFKTQGFNALSGAIKFVDIYAYDNGFHGVGVSQSTTFGDEAVLINVTANNNGGYGIDVGSGKAFVRNVVCRRNSYAGMKISTGLQRLDLDGALFEGNVQHGFLNTGDAPDAEIIIDNVVTRNNGSVGFSLSTGGKVSIGRIVSIGDAPATVNAEAGSIMIACKRFTAQTLYAENSNANGVVMDTSNGMDNFTIGNVTGVGNYKSPFFVSSGMTATSLRGVVSSALLRNNNQQGLSGISAAAVRVLSAAQIAFNGVIFDDTQAIPTQTVGFGLTAGADVYVDGTSFGRGIAANSQVISSVSPTRCRFGNGNFGIVTRLRGQHSANGGGTNVTLTFPTPLTNLGGAVFFGQVTPASADARGDFHVSVGATFVQALYGAATPAGTANVKYFYDVAMEVQR